MLDDSKTMFKSVSANHHNVYVVTEKLKESVQELAVHNNINELADIAMALNESYKLLDDSRKTVKALKEKLDMLVCALWSKTPDAAQATRIATDYCYVHPKVDVVVQVPHRGTKPEAFERFMKAFNIPEELYKFRQTEENGAVVHDSDGNEIIDLETPELVRLHYPGIVEWVKRELAAGKPLPPEIEELGNKFNVYSLKIIPRKGVLEE